MSHDLAKRSRRIPSGQQPLPTPEHLKSPPALTLSGLWFRELGRSLALRAVFVAMHLAFSLYIRIRKAWHSLMFALASVLFYRGRTAKLIRRDVATLSKKPNHLSVILTAEDDGRAGAELERLINETTQLAAWTVCAGIPVLSVYEKTGILKKYVRQVHHKTVETLQSYLGPDHPALTTTAPHQDDVETSGPDGHLRLYLVSSQDGRDSLVDLTKTLVDMSQGAKLSIRDIQPDLIDTELSEGVFPEPNLLVLFSPHIQLAGYPPWHLRSTEIFCRQDNEGFGYPVFFAALRNYASAQIRNGR